MNAIPRRSPLPAGDSRIGWRCLLLLAAAILLASCAGERKPESVLLVEPSVTDEQLTYVRSLNPGSELWTSTDGSQRFLEFYAPRKLGTNVARALANPFVAVYRGTTYLVGFALIGAVGAAGHTSGNR